MSHIIKEGRRQRYIGFQINIQTKQPPIDRSTMIATLRQQCRRQFNTDCKMLGIYLTKFNGKQGIVRCSHREKDRTIQMLTSISKIASYTVAIETLGTSGTIKSLMKKHMVNTF
ncbi:MAG: Rpp14/Pop5 family protein [Candidatus Thermoplasmatota archaeon]|nr:Rpp14/Pop5 family protein [Candidatus Thermoplasmatota archaeon]